MSVRNEELNEQSITQSDPLAILAESGVDVFAMSENVRGVLDELSPEEARLLASVNSRLESVEDFNARGGGGINH